jgi:hypothetical protein
LLQRADQDRTHSVIVLKLETDLGEQRAAKDWRSVKKDSKLFLGIEEISARRLSGHVFRCPSALNGDDKDLALVHPQIEVNEPDTLTLPEQLHCKLKSRAVEFGHGERIARH